MSQAESFSAASTISCFDTLENKFLNLENQPSEVFNLLKGDDSSIFLAAHAVKPSTASDAPSDPADQVTATVEAFKNGKLQFSIATPSYEQMGETFATWRDYAATEEMKKFEKLLTVTTFPTKMFSTGPKWLIGRLK